MKKPSSPDSVRNELREKLIGLGEHSIRKSYYPELQKQLENLKERVGLAELVAEIGKDLTEEQDLRSSLQRCSDSLLQRTAAAFVRIWTLDRAEEILELQASSGLHTNIEGNHCRINVKDYPYKIGIIARGKRPIMTNRVVDNPLFHNQEWIKAQGIAAFAGYPLLIQQRLVGVVALFAQRPLKETVLDTLSTIVNQIAVSIERFHALDAYKAALANAKESHEKVNGILRSVADPLLVIDNDRRIMHMNQAAENLLGVSLAIVFRKRVDEVCGQKALLDYLSRIEEFIARDEEIDLAMIDRSNDERRIIQAHCAQLIGVQSGSGMVVSLHDVTQDRQLARMKSEFIKTAAHELRTPLTTIMGFAEMLYENEWERETQREYLGYILDKADVLAQIIDNLLDLSRIESGHRLDLNYSDWHLRHVLEKIIARCRREYRGYRFNALLSDNLGMIHADREKVMQIIDNLLSNAVKYSPKGSEILFEAHCDDENLTVAVSDHGIGMTEEQIEKSFDNFYRADSSDTAVGGLGLGLSIVRQAVESHNGRIQISSRPGEGTVVSFTLPLHGWEVSADSL